MHGTIDKSGNVTITFNVANGERLNTLSIEPGSGRPCLEHFLPCKTCGKIVKVALNVVGGICDECEEHRTSGCDLIDCENPIHPDHEARRDVRLQRCDEGNARDASEHRS